MKIILVLITFAALINKQWTHARISSDFCGFNPKNMEKFVECILSNVPKTVEKELLELVASYGGLTPEAVIYTVCNISLDASSAFIHEVMRNVDDEEIIIEAEGSAQDCIDNIAKLQKTEQSKKG